MGKRGNRSRGRNRSNQANRASDPGEQRGRQANRGRRGKKSKVPFDPEKHIMPAAVPDREYESCPISGEEIDDIYAAIADPESGRPARLDKVIERLEQTEQLEEGERIAYLGKGAFGIVSIRTGENGRPELYVRKRIQYEDSHDKHQWRRELAPGISRDYKPDPEPLSELYTREELTRFPRFDTSGSSHMSRSN